jgi:hypothetical protein
MSRASAYRRRRSARGIVLVTTAVTTKTRGPQGTSGDHRGNVGRESAGRGMIGDRRGRAGMGRAGFKSPRLRSLRSLFRMTNNDGRLESDGISMRP